MADYDYYYEDGDRIYEQRPPPPPQGPGQKVMDLLRENEELKQQLEELKAVRSLTAIASELESGPIVKKEGETTRVLTNFTVQVRNYAFKVDRVTNAYHVNGQWEVKCGYGDFRFWTSDPNLIDSECEAAADLFDALQALATEQNQIKYDFKDSRNKDKVTWENLDW